MTLGLIESYFNNKTIEIFTSNGYIFIKCEDDNNKVLFLDLESGIVRDYFSNYGLLGTMPCYHDNITNNAWNYGNNLLNNTSKEFDDLQNISNFSTDLSLVLGLISTESLVVGESVGLEMGGLALGEFSLILLVPVVFELLRPNIADLLELYGLNEMAEYYRTNNTLVMFIDSIFYLIYGENSRIPLEQRIMLFSFFAFNFNTYPYFITFSMLNNNSDLHKSYNFVISFAKMRYDSIDLNLNNAKDVIKNAPGSGPKLPLGELGKKLRESYHQLKESIKRGDVKGIIYNSLVLAFSGFCVGVLIFNFLGNQISEKFIQTVEDFILESIP